MEQDDLRKLMAAVSEGDVVLVGDMLRGRKSGDLVNALCWEDSCDCSAVLHRAAATGNVQMMQVLVAHGADVSMRACDGEMDGCFIRAGRFAAEGERSEDAHMCATPLHFAAWYGMRDAADWLLRNGAKIDAHSAAALGYVEEVAKCLSEGAAKHAGILLQWAAVAGAVESIPLLLRCHPDRLSMSIALGNAIGNERDAVVTVLLAAGARLANQPENWSLNQNIMDDSVQVVRLLIQAGVNVNSGPAGTHPLVQAASKGNLAIVELLLKAGSSPNVTAEFFREVRPGEFEQAVGTPLDAAIVCGHEDVAAILREQIPKA